MKIINVTNNLASLLIKYISENELEADAELLERLNCHQSGEVLSYQLWSQYLEQLAALSNNPRLGIELGELAESEHAGIVAYLASSCDTLAGALIHFARFQTLLYGSEAKIESTADNIRVRWPPDMSWSIDTRISDEVLIIGLICFIKRLVGPISELPKIGFVHERPDYFEAYGEHLGERLSFANDELSVEFSTRLLSLAIHRPEPVLKDILQQQAEVLLQEYNESSKDFYQTIKRALIQCINESSMTLKSLSLRMNMTSRTLQRRLKEENLNFNQLLKDTRLEMARQYLDENTLSLTAISELLGYTEQSAFSRAFKQWAGETPKQYLSREKQTY